MPTKVDSAKFIEHLRVVHFTLILTCFGLLLFTSLNQKDRATYALEQLRDIRTVVDGWNPYWLKQYVEKTVGGSGTGLLALDKDLRNGLWIDAPSLYMRNTVFDARIFSSYVAEADDDYLTSVLSGAPQNESIYRGFTASDKNRDDNTEIVSLFLKPPGSISEFRLLWNGLGKKLVVHNFHSPSSSISISKTHQSLIGMGGTVGMGGMSPHDWRARTGTDNTKNVVQVKLESVRRSDSNGQVDAGPLSFWIIGGDENSGFELALKTSSTKMELDPRFGLLDGPLELRPFEEIFPELNQLSTDFDTLSLDKLETILRKERDRRRDSFTAFGIKIPNEAISIWGPLTIVIIQLYFALHLSSFLNGRNAPEMSVIVPWIGLYNEPISFIVTFLSSSIFPVIVILYLGVRFWSGDFWAVVAFAIPFFLSINIGVITSRVFSNYHGISVIRWSFIK